jgi:CO/xanthine dehydrogenase Mo-binding subunit
MIPGSSRYLDDLRVEGAPPACFVRSIMAHARVLGIGVTEAIG